MKDEWFEYRLENDPRFLARIARARRSIASEKGTALEDLGEPPARKKR